MRITKDLLFFIIATIFSGVQVFAQEYQPLDMRVPYTPGVVIIDKKPTIYYELHLTSLANDSIDFKKLEVIDPADSMVIFSINKDELKKRYSSIREPGKENENILPPGASGIIYLEFVLQNNKPDFQLAHRIELETRHKNERKLLSAQGAVIHLSKKPQLVLGPPLNGGAWAAIYDPSWERGHRRVIYTIDGKARIPGRFAIDFIKLDEKGRYAEGDDNVIENWYGYGNDVLAVADGVIASIRDDFSESPTLSGHLAYSADKATGNYISIDIGNEHIVFYEHLKPGSIKVKPGQQVKKGDLIAALGFTGQTTGPHLHFHVANANSPLGAEGIPFAFERFSMLGFYMNFENFGKAPWIPVKNLDQSMVSGERPAPNSVIRF